MEKTVRVLSRTETRIELLFEGYPPVLVNALRRLILSEVPTLAVDFMYVYDNSSSVFDEILAHRIGLLVLDSNEALTRLRSPEECVNASEEDESCYVKMILDVEVPAREESGRYVNAGEIKVGSNITRIVYPETPLLYLAPGQRVHAVAYARLGRGKEHGKWSPASAAVMQYVPVVHIKSGNVGEKCLECLSAYPEVVNAIRTGETRIEYLKNINTSGLHYCAETECRDAIELEYDSTRQILTVESTGALRPERIVLESVRALEAKARKLKERIREAKVEENE